MYSRLEFENILRMHGHNVLLQRRKFEHESGPYMEIEGGRYTPQAEKWTIWRRYAGQVPMGLKGDVFAPFGLVDGSGIIYYFQAAALPKSGDLIREETPHELNPFALYRVDTSVPYYDGNEIIFFAAHSKRLEPIS